MRRPQAPRRPGRIVSAAAGRARAARLTRHLPAATLERKRGAVTKHIIRLTLILCAALVAALCLGAGAAAPARAASPDEQMADAVMALRGLIDREGAERYFTYPRRTSVRPGKLGGSWWPDDPWTGADLRPGSRRGHFRYFVTPDRRRYRLVGYLDGGRTIVALRRDAPHDHARLRPPQRGGHQPHPPVRGGLRRRARRRVPAAGGRPQRRGRRPRAPATLLAQQPLGPLRHGAARRRRVVRVLDRPRQGFVHAAPAPRPQGRLRAHRQPS